MKWIERLFKGNMLGVHLALNVFLATSILWLLLRKAADLNPIWAISSMIAASDPEVTTAVKTFRGRLVNALLGCVVGFLFLVVGGSSAWKLPVALSVTALLSSYVIRVPTMWRQAPITAAIIIASGLEKDPKWIGMEMGLRRVGEVLLGCVIGLVVTYIVSRIWPLPTASVPRSD